MPLLQPGSEVRLVQTDQRLTVQSFLAEGGQGEVWVASVAGGPPLALKWYKPRSATAVQRASIETLVKAGPPNDRFLWPLDVAENDSSFGYVMPLRPDRYRGLSHLLRGAVSMNARTLIGSAIQLAESFYSLHAQGLCYRDISFGNTFFDFATGDVLICDNDNVGVDRVASTTVLGTAGFMAPEVLRGDAGPSSLSDLHSLAVLLFYMFMLHHPLLGKREHEWACLDDEAWMELTGWRPLFIFDPVDDTNAPVPHAHQNAILNWPMYPASLRRLFTRAFTEGLVHPEARVRETEWRRELAQLRDATFRCAGCGVDRFLDDSLGAAAPCPMCQSTVAPPVLRLGSGGIVVLDERATLFPHHLRNRPYDFSVALAEVSRHPTDARIGLRNLGDQPWTAQVDGHTFEVAPGRSVEAIPGLELQFGGVKGAVGATAS